MQKLSEKWRSRKKKKAPHNKGSTKRRQQAKRKEIKKETEKRTKRNKIKEMERKDDHTGGDRKWNAKMAQRVQRVDEARKGNGGGHRSVNEANRSTKTSRLFSFSPSLVRRPLLNLGEDPRRLIRSRRKKLVRRSKDTYQRRELLQRER